MGRGQGATKEHIYMLDVTVEQRSRRPIFIATLWAAPLLAGCPAAAGSLIGQRPQRVFSLFASRIQPKYKAAPLPQSLTWCTSLALVARSCEPRYFDPSLTP